jgi:hypothetical protein
MKKWGAIEIVAEVICGIATVVSLIAGAKNDEDLDERVERILDDRQKEVEE